ncbi:MAG: EamA family transporter RarD [Sphingomicrobium sp.]
MNSADPSPERRTGFLYGLAAYGFWGVLPIYFKQIPNVPPVDVVAHRVIWSVPLLLALLGLTGGLAGLRETVHQPRLIGLLAITAVLIAVNWLLYIYAITSGHILAGSLGYYLNPLANVLLGRFVLKERLTSLQWAAVIIAALGIGALAIGALGQLWISLGLCFSFATYGLLRKMAPVDSPIGLTIETALLLPFAGVWLALGVAAGKPSFGSTTHDTLFLVAAGIVSTTPLLLFTAAARKLPYSTLGMLQFIAPTLQFLLAVAVYGEPFTTAHAVAFGAIWTALAMFVLAITRAGDAASVPERTETPAEARRSSRASN